ncbi:biotinidase [Gadus chalcogrammus]|uniref:biotinidase n=1 Tax=Gadus chalcogrammus TaxID=1042646 RepID=UPI0024C4E5C6|nr:biotinidase [Gadus chalcogrammus]
METLTALTMDIRGFSITLCFLICVFPSSFGLNPDEVERLGRSSYIAAVYEHRVVLTPEPHLARTRAAALRHMRTNLDVFEEQARRASQQGVQILVFPEDGIHGFNFSRSSISSYLETVPDPRLESWNPCTQPGRYNNTDVLQRLSCMARCYSLYLVANMASLQPCPASTDPPTCPPDGRWQFNTDVVFSSDGQLVARYHKQNLYFEKAFDVPPSPELITFDTPFAGRFGVLTCFDLMFREPAVGLVERGVRQLVYPTAWMNQLPLLAAAQFQRAFSLGAGVTVLAANVRSDVLGMTGSGIFTPASALAHHHSFQGQPEEGRLLVARVPVLDPLWSGAEEEAAGGEVEDVGGDGSFWSVVESRHCKQEENNCLDSMASTPSPSLRPVTSSSPTFHSSMMYDLFTFARLPAVQGQLRVCQGTLCCHLQYRRSQPGGGELYALGAFTGTHTVNGRYALQVCALVRCAGQKATSCGQEVVEAESKMDFVLSGRFETPHVYPSLVVSGVKLEQPRHLDIKPTGTVTMAHSNMAAGLVTACLYGRMYHLDRV